MPGAPPRGRLPACAAARLSAASERCIKAPCWLSQPPLPVADCAVQGDLYSLPGDGVLTSGYGASPNSASAGALHRSRTGPLIKEPGSPGDSGAAAWAKGRCACLPALVATAPTHASHSGDQRWRLCPPESLARSRARRHLELRRAQGRAPCPGHPQPEQPLRRPAGGLCECLASLGEAKHARRPS